MKLNFVLRFQQCGVSLLKRPWKTFRDGTLFYGNVKTGNKRLALTTKHGNKNMYKGTRSSGIGKHTKRGKYIIDWMKVKTFVVPKVTNESLKPLVSCNVPHLKQNFSDYERGLHDPEFYYNQLKNYIHYGSRQTEAANIECFEESMK